MTVWRGVVVRLECLSSMELSDVLVSLVILKLENLESVQTRTTDLLKYWKPSRSHVFEGGGEDDLTDCLPSLAAD